VKLDTETKNLLSKQVTVASIEVMAQLTRFVVRKQMTAEESAKLAWDMATALALEGKRRLEAM
jgi:hypothetical protein